jgi:hypothetical protein
MINKLKSFTVEEKLLIQAIISEYFKNTMSAELISTTWDLRTYAPNNKEVMSIKSFVSYVSDLQIEIGIELATAGIPQEMWLKAPISKTVFQSMSKVKKNIVKELLNTLGAKLGNFELIGTLVMGNIWDNKLIE